MNQNDASKSSVTYQRRSQSVDEYALKKLDEELYGSDDERNSRTLSNGKYETIKEHDDVYVSAPLPRMNRRPSARACWLVYFFYSLKPKYLIILLAHLN
jgi:hypothetical protein